MVGQAKLTFHENLELHEWVQSEVVGVKRMKANLGQVQDQELKNLIQTIMDAKKARIYEINQFLVNMQDPASTQPF